ncbi:DNA repair protein rad50 [Irineochytrium annulatum]|nr:DNA repair protein rad50 [Irineochytrium annulatum]
MSKIEKLSIRGIRSFDPQEVSIIEFFTPLTLIVGHNGAGKTIAKETEVKAQVKLRFRNVNGKEMVCTRSIALSLKKASATQRTLESLLSTSNEPLSEPAVLKKKFDDIFASTRYTKALAEIKAFRKDQTAQIKVDENELHHLRVNKEKADEVARELQILKGRITRGIERKSALEGGEINDVLEKLRGMERELQKYQKVETDLRESQMKKDLIMGNIDEITKSITIYEDSDEELMDMLQQYQNSIKNRGAEYSTLDEKNRRLRHDLQTKEKSQNQALTKRGKLQAEEEVESDRQRVCGEIALTNDYATEDPEQIIENLRRDVDACKQQSETLKSEARAAEDVLLQQVQDLKTKQSGAEEMQRLARKQQDENRSKSMALNKKLSDTPWMEIEMDEVESKLRDEEEALTAAQKSLAALDFDQKHKSLNQDLQLREHAAARLSDELSSLNAQSETRVRLSLKKAELDTKEKKIKAMVSTLSSNVRQIFNRVPVESNLEKLKVIEPVLDGQDFMTAYQRAEAVYEEEHTYTLIL